MGFLVGKTIQAVKLASDKMAILFVCDDGEHVAKCDAGCCSHTWIEDVTLPTLPAKVLEYLDLDMPGGQEVGDYGYIQYYGLTIKTDRGDLTLEYRNESNRYYGGNLSWPDDSYFYGGVYGQNESNLDWEPV